VCAALGNAYPLQKQPRGDHLNVSEGREAGTEKPKTRERAFAHSAIVEVNNPDQRRRGSAEERLKKQGNDYNEEDSNNKKRRRRRVSFLRIRYTRGK